jgi:hypothetical protein
MDTLSFQRLVILLGGKMNAVSFLMEFMKSGEMPLDLHYGLDQLLAPKNASAVELQYIIMPGMQVMEALVKYRSELKLVPTNVPWEEDILRVVKEYLEVRRPEEQLEVIAQNLELLRQAIAENFELKDVLLKVANRRKTQ